MARWACAALAATLALGRAASAADSPILKLGGDVEHSLALTLAEVKAMPQARVDASFGTMHGQEHHVWTGVKLLDLIDMAGLKAEPVKFAALRHTVLIHGKDGYEVAIALGELEPMAENKPVILAYRSDAGPNDFPALRLVVPGDQHGARQVHDVVEIEVK